MPTDIATLAYAAGIFDGEGSVVIRSMKKKGEDVARYHNVSVSVTSTDTILTDWLSATFGGRVAANHKENAARNYKDAWKWQLLSQQAENFLRAVHPYLKIKVRQADVAFRLRKTTGAGRATPVTDELFSHRESLKAEMKALNRRGRPAETDTGEADMETIDV